MRKLKLEIDLLPKGAWGNDLSVTLAKKDWDTLRTNCYEKANGICQICGCQADNLQAHEVWNFNIANKTQTLQNIIGICSKCHGVIHYRNSKRLGHGENAKRHFMQVNHVDENVFNEHLTQALSLFEERNTVFHWRMVADLSKFGGVDIELKNNYFPIINNPYSDNEIENLRCQLTGKPVVTELVVDNYRGTVKVKCTYTNKIQWFADEKLVAIKYNFSNDLVVTFCVKNLIEHKLQFRLIGNKGEYESKFFILT